MTSENINPYQAPAIHDDMATDKFDWLAQPSKSLARVRSGVNLILISTYIMLISIIAMILAVFVFQIFSLFAFFFMIVAAIAHLVGQVYCMSVPAEVGAKGLIQSSFALSIASLVLQFADAFLMMPEVVKLALLLLNPIANLLFMLFLMALARMIENKSLIRFATIVFGLFLGLIVAYLVGMAIILNWGPFGAAQELLGLLTIPWGIGGLVAVVMYLRLLSQLKNLLRVRKPKSPAMEFALPPP